MTDDHEIADRVWQVIESAGICMMTTKFEDGLRARPLEARPDRAGNVIWFLTDKRGLKDDEIDAHSDVCLTFFYLKEKVYLSITGRAFVSQNAPQAEKLWNEEQQVWWPGGPHDPNVLVIRFEPALPKCGMVLQARQLPLVSSPGTNNRHKAQSRREAQGFC
jgi:general stress protein 26